MSDRTCSVDGCNGQVRARGWCGMHYMRWYDHGDPTVPVVTHERGPVEKRFWTKVDHSGGPDACWPWIGGRTQPRGYGRIGYDGRRVGAHRVAYRLATGQEPGTLDVCHRCDNPPCCNPAHLFLGTRSDNMKDCVAKGRRPMTSTCQLDGCDRQHYGRGLCKKHWARWNRRQRSHAAQQDPSCGRA